MSRNIKDLVKNKKARFICYKDENLWYKTEDGFEFPIPISDTKGGVFGAETKAISLMRWIRKHVDFLESQGI